MTTTGTRRGEYAKTAERRQDIIGAAVEVFSTSGFRSGSLREVADLVGLSQAGLLHHFPSKKALLGAVLEWRDTDTMARFGASSARGIDVFRTLLRTVEHNSTTPELVELHVLLSAEATSVEHPAHDYFKRRYALVVTHVETALHQAAEDGHLHEHVTPPAAARAVIALMDGLQVQWLLARESVDMAVDLRCAFQEMFSEPL